MLLCIYMCGVRGGVGVYISVDVYLYYVCMDGWVYGWMDSLYPAVVKISYTEVKTLQCVQTSEKAIMN